MNNSHYHNLRNQSDMSQLVYAYTWYKQHNMHNKAKQCLKAIESLLEQPEAQAA